MSRLANLSEIVSKVCHVKWLINYSRQLRNVGTAYARIGVFWVISSSSYAQLPDFSTTWSRDEFLFKASQFEVVGTDLNQGFYVVRSAAKNGIPYSLEHYDKKLHLSNTLKTKEEGNNGTFEKVIQLNRILHAIYSEIDHHSKKLTLYARTLDDATLQPGKERKVLCVIDFTGHPATNKKRFSFTFSGDSSKFFVMRNFSKFSDNRDYYACMLFDRDLNLMWQKMAEFPYYGEQFGVQNVKINKRGNVFILGRTSNLYDIVSLVSNGDSIVRYPVRLKGHQISGAQIEIVDDTKLFCAGFYSKSDVQNVRGTYFLNIDPARKKIKSGNSEEFDLKFILKEQTVNDMKLTMQKGELGEPAELYRYTLDKIWIEKNGSIFLVGEQRYRYSNTQMHYTPGFPVGRSVRYPAAYADQMSALINTTYSARNYHYVANDILVVKLDSTGHIQWSRKIQKSQNSIDDNGVYSSFLTGNIHQKLFFLFNDNPRNLNEKWLNRPQDFTGGLSIVTMVSLTEEGEPVRNWIYLTAREIKVIPKMSNWISGSSLILFGRRDSFQQLAEVTFK